MSRKSGKSQANIERLLDERRQVEAWLAKLADPEASSMPASVVEKVRADYRARLDTATRQLAKHEGELEMALAEAEARRDQMTEQRAARAAELAEAELRCRVGEYDDAKFEELSAEASAALAQLSADIEAGQRDMDRLEEVLNLIAGAIPAAGAPAPIAQAPSPPPVAAQAPASAPAASDVTQPPPPAPPPAALVPPPAAEPVAAAPAPPPGVPSPEGEPAVAAAEPASQTGQIDALDELEFLRSVAGSEGKEAAAPPPRQARPKPPPKAAPSPVAARQAATPDSKAAAALRPSLGEADVATKTLRCTECGVLNLPTEWYCEKCGAELSAF